MCGRLVPLVLPHMAPQKRGELHGIAKTIGMLRDQWSESACVARYSSHAARQPKKGVSILSHLS